MTDDSQGTTVASPIAASPSAGGGDSTAAAPAPISPSVSSEPSAPAPVAASTETATSLPEVKTETPAEPSLFATEAPTADAKNEPAAESKVDDKTPEVKAEVKPEDKKPEAKTDGKPAEVRAEAPVIPTYEPFKLPEEFKADEKAMGEFAGLLGQIELAKGDHKATQELGQKLADLYASNVQQALKTQQEYFVQLHNQNIQKAQDELKKDPYFGANGDQAGQIKVKMELAGFLQRNVPKEDLNAFRSFVEEKGIGDSLPLAKLINTLKQKIDKYETESAKMLPGTKPAPTKVPVGQQSIRGMQQTMYGGNKG